MKRLASSDSLAGVVSVSPSSDERGFHSILEGLNEEEEGVGDPAQISEKKRRLSVDQVKALEKNFELENKLEPERKIKLAQELGLQPRQVAVWFQNRRARWKTKQLEKDYGSLRANYDALKHNFAALQQDNETLLSQLRDLRSKLAEETKTTIKEEELMSPEGEITTPHVAESENKSEKILNEDSDSSAVLDDNNSSSPPRPASPDGSLSLPPPMAMLISSSSSTSCTELPQTGGGGHWKGGYHQFLRMEEHNFLSSAEESCNLFSDEQAPSLPWYCSEPWN